MLCELCFPTLQLFFITPYATLFSSLHYNNQNFPQIVVCVNECKWFWLSWGEDNIVMYVRSFIKVMAISIKIKQKYF